MPLILSGNVASATAAVGYSVANSVRFNDGDSPYLKDSTGDAAPAGNRQKFTFSIWFKRSSVGATQILASSSYSGSDEGYLFLSGGGILGWQSNNSGDGNLGTAMLFRDLSAWYHVVFSVDTTQSTATNRIKLYINGSQYTWDGSNTTQPNQNQSLYWNVGGTYYPYIGRRNGGDYFDGYIGEVAQVDNAQLAATSFGEFDEDSPTIWKPKDLSDLTFGTSGYWLDMEDSSDFGNDVSGVGNDFVATNLAATDQATDTPTNNFCTLNPLDMNLSGVTLSEANLKIATSATNVGGRGTMGASSGKWFWEVLVVAKGDNVALIGIAQPSNWVLNYVGSSSTSYSYSSGAEKYNNTASSSFGASWTDGDYIGVALNMDDGVISFYKDGSSQGDAYTGIPTTDFMMPAFSGQANTDFSVNFGSPPYAISSGNADANGYGNFEYAVPSGYFALCTKNLAEYG